MNETNHPARRLRHGDRPTEPLVFDDAAANKAAEEGGLPELITEAGDLADALRFHHESDVWDWDDLLDAASMIDRLAADRASRQVANKAEVDLIDELAQIAKVWDGCEYDDVGGAVDIGQSLRKAFGRILAKVATPPATTGASTVLTDERIKEIANQHIRNNGWSLNSPVDFARAIESEVAAQAGQVAVQEYAFPTFEHWLASGIETASDGLTQQQKTIGYARLAFNAGRASPAKESK